MAYKNKILTFQDIRGIESKYPPKRTWSDTKSKLYSSYKCLTFKELNDNYLMETDSYVGNENRLVFENQFPTSKIFSYQLSVVFHSRSTVPKFPTRFMMDGYLGTVYYGGNSGIKDVEWKFQIYSTPNSLSGFDSIENYTFDPMHVREDEGQFLLSDDHVQLEITAYYGLNDEITFSYYNNKIANNFNTYTLSVNNNQYTIRCFPSVKATLKDTLVVNFVNGTNVDITYPIFWEVEYSDNPRFTDGTVEKIKPTTSLSTSTPPKELIANFRTKTYPIDTIIYIRSTNTNNRLNFGECSIPRLSPTSINLIAPSPNSDYIAIRLDTNGTNEFNIVLTLET